MLIRVVVTYGCIHPELSSKDKKGMHMITEEVVKDWMRQRMTSGNYDSAASLARDFLDEHQICDVMDPAFMCVINAGFSLAPEMAQQKDRVFYEFS